MIYVHSQVFCLPIFFSLVQANFVVEAKGGVLLPPYIQCGCPAETNN